MIECRVTCSSPSMPRNTDSIVARSAPRNELPGIIGCPELSTARLSPSPPIRSGDSSVKSPTSVSLDQNALKLIVISQRFHRQMKRIADRHRTIAALTAYADAVSVQEV